MHPRLETIIWRRLDTPGHESAGIFRIKSRWTLMGTAVFLYDRRSCRLDYLVRCDHQWQTVSAKIEGWVGNRLIDINISVDSERNWQLNRKKCVEVKGCVDLDLNFSPLTNTLPVRRLNLAVGQEANVRAAWLKFPNFELEPLDQAYRRVSISEYHYETGGKKFEADLEVDEAGFVIHYPKLWRTEDS